MRLTTSPSVVLLSTMVGVMSSVSVVSALMWHRADLAWALVAVALVDCLVIGWLAASAPGRRDDGADLDDKPAVNLSKLHGPVVVSRGGAEGHGQDTMELHGSEDDPIVVPRRAGGKV